MRRYEQKKKMINTMINNFIFILYISLFISFHLSIIEVDSAKV